jgi:DNA-binding beta-propeller fold protein YncE
VAIGPDGSVYVADSGNQRIQKFTTDGSFVTAWGHECRMYEDKAGCESPDGAGGFYDPWGVAVDQDGYVYVADTWNHRVQKFTSDGQFATMWGEYATANTVTDAEGMFWGPRSIAIDPEGSIYVSDTGNKRIQVFTPDGEPVTQWGGNGALDGQFDEPVGIAIASDGRTYVADTWNQRIQVFESSHFYLKKWEVYAWPGQSLENKPYLAIDAVNRIYATDPEGYRILVFDEDGKYLASLEQYGSDDQGFMLPTGIAIDAQGYIYVADTATHRVMKLAPFE